MHSVTRLIVAAPPFPLYSSCSFYFFSSSLCFPNQRSFCLQRRCLTNSSSLFQKKPAFFASDNAASVHPGILSSLSSVISEQNECLGYGFEEFTEGVKRKVCGFLECPEAQVEFVYGGTGGNMCVMALLKKGDGIAASTCAHIYDDESGGPEFGGNKIYPVKTKEGKINVKELKKQYNFGKDGGFHRAPVKMVSITQPTERGTVYSPDEIQQISNFCQENDLILHMDGARVGNALPFSGCTLAEMTWKVGVDVLTLGGTKHGLMYGEAIIIFNDNIKNSSFIRLQKMLGQKASKVQFLSLLLNDLLRLNSKR